MFFISPFHREIIRTHEDLGNIWVFLFPSILKQIQDTILWNTSRIHHYGVNVCVYFFAADTVPNSWTSKGTVPYRQFLSCTNRKKHQKTQDSWPARAWNFSCLGFCQKCHIFSIVFPPRVWWYCWWFVRNPGSTHQLRLVVYPTIYKYMSGGAGFIPSTKGKSLETTCYESPTSTPARTVLEGRQ